jgi:inhibitor-of-growth protein 1
MLNQVAVEAIYSATYLENYLDSVENLPNDLQRHISRMRQLDVDFQGRSTILLNFVCFLKVTNTGFILAILRDIEHYSDVIQRGPEAQESQLDSGDEKPSGSGLTASSGGNAGHWRKRLLQKVQSALISSLEIGDEKLQLVQTVQDVIENKSRQLETDCKALGSTSFKKKS